VSGRYEATYSNGVPIGLEKVCVHHTKLIEVSAEGHLKVTDIVVPTQITTISIEYTRD
jgi:hypothetical protein